MEQRGEVLIIGWLGDLGGGKAVRWKKKRIEGEEGYI
jgi:hypothetical protein